VNQARPDATDHAGTRDLAARADLLVPPDEQDLAERLVAREREEPTGALERRAHSDVRVTTAPLVHVDVSGKTGNLDETDYVETMEFVDQSDATVRWVTLDLPVSREPMDRVDLPEQTDASAIAESRRRVRTERVAHRAHRAQTETRELAARLENKVLLVVLARQGARAPTARRELPAPSGCADPTDRRPPTRARFGDSRDGQDATASRVRSDGVARPASHGPDRPDRPAPRTPSDRLALPVPQDLRVHPDVMDPPDRQEWRELRESWDRRRRRHGHCHCPTGHVSCDT
jgi:hypothetical protein